MSQDRSAVTNKDEDDYNEALDNDNGEDFEATIAEEELLDGGDYSDELKDLADDNELSVEELRKKYGYPGNGDVSNLPDDDDEEEDFEGEDEEVVENEETEEGNLESTNQNEEVNVPQPNLNDLGNSLSGLDDDDDDYAPPDPYKKSVRVDQQKYQAEIPNLLTEEEKDIPPGKDKDENDNAILLWAGNELISDEKLNGYLSDVVDIRVSHDQVPPLQASLTRDDEDALCALYRNNYDVENAKKSYPFPHVNAPTQTVRPDALSWDETEHKTFENSLEMYGKDFSLIKRLSLPYRKVGEIVEYYYQWKQTPGYRIWREAHPQHAPVVQPHVATSFVSFSSHLPHHSENNHENNAGGPPYLYSPQSDEANAPSTP